RRTLRYVEPLSDARTHTPCQTGLIDNAKSRMLEWRRLSLFARYESRVPLHDFTEAVMDMMGRVGLIEIPILIAPDQKVWMDRMIKEGKIAIPPGGTLEKGSLYSMFVRMLLHNAMEEQKRQEVLDAEDEDDE
ncbi:MAG TPA: hypothetical protein VNS88_15840, partial [Nitrospiraceae bacterium]|nr:hypothetical protein [Nitrospiraceae bacterium]